MVMKCLILLCEVVELKTGDSVRDAIQFLYEMNVSGAPIADTSDLNFDAAPAAPRLLCDRYIGFIDFASMVLWSLEVKYHIHNPT